MKRFISYYLVTLTLSLFTTYGCSGRQLDSFQMQDAGVDAETPDIQGNSASDANPLQEDAPSAEKRSICIDEHWCWENPSPQGRSLSWVWGSSSQDVFAIGRRGTILHYNGTEWSGQTSGTQASLNGLWGSGPDNIFAVGYDGTILHYDGAAWTGQTSGTSKDIYGVWGSGPDNIYAVGGSGTILHHDGNTWSHRTSGTTDYLNAIWGSGPDDIYAVGSGGTILHYDGTSWSQQTSGTTETLNGVWGSGPDDVFAASYYGTVLHFDGTGWTEHLAASGGYFTGAGAIWGSGPDDVYVMVGTGGSVRHYDGTSWTKVMSGSSEPLSGIWGSRANDVFAVGIDGYIVHFDGSAFSSQTVGVRSYLYGAWAAARTMCSSRAKMEVSCITMGHPGKARCPALSRISRTPGQRTGQRLRRGLERDDPALRRYRLVQPGLRSPWDLDKAG